MKNLNYLSDSELLENLQDLVREERRITLEILWHLREVESRRLFALRGFSSLFDYCVAGLGYSESAAYRRITTMRALKESPELESAIRSGRLSVTTVARVQTFFRAERVHGERTYSDREKSQLFQSLEGKSSKEVEKSLMQLSPQSALPKETERVISAELTEIRFTADDELMKQLKAARDLFSHQLKDPNSYAELIGLLARKSLAKVSESGPAKNVGQDRSVALAEVKSHSRYIPQAVRREVWKKSGHRCTYVDPVTKRKCESTFRLQVDHGVPFARGGSSTDAENLTLLCACHNQLRARQVFGDRVMDRWRSPGRWA